MVPLAVLVPVELVRVDVVPLSLGQLRTAGQIQIMILIFESRCYAIISRIKCYQLFREIFLFLVINESFCLFVSFLGWWLV